MRATCWRDNVCILFNNTLRQRSEQVYLCSLGEPAADGIVGRDAAPTITAPMIVEEQVRVSVLGWLVQPQLDSAFRAGYLYI